MTAGTLRGFRLMGVPVRFHFTFVLLMIFLVVSAFSGESGKAYSWFLGGLFASVLLHEIAHAVTARGFGERTIEIVMFPIGGVTRMERTPRPTAELWISLAGPLFNLVIAAAILIFMAGSHRTISFQFGEWLNLTDADILPRIAFANVLLAGFNLIPAFPMDGGRAMRALLSYIWPEDEATRLAAWMGRALAISLGLYGLIAGQFILVFMAMFIYLGALQEGVAARGRQLTQGIPVRAAMMTRFETLGHGDCVRDAANLLLATSQEDFPVMHGEQVIGLLGRTGMIRALANEGAEAYVAGVMERDYLVLEPNLDLADVLPLMARAGHCALVMDHGRLLGLLTTDNLSEFLMLRQVGMEPVLQG